MPEDKHESNYRIGAVSRLTGIPPDTLRVWERRYDLITPMRSEGGSCINSVGLWRGKWANRMSAVVTATASAGRIQTESTDS